MRILVATVLAFVLGALSHRTYRWLEGATTWDRGYEDGYADGWPDGFDKGHETGVGDLFDMAAEQARKTREAEG